MTVKDEERNMSVDRRERPEINPYTHRIFDLRKAASQNTWSKKDFLRGQGTSLVVQWLGLCAPIDGGLGSIPGQGTKISKAMW